MKRPREIPWERLLASEIPVATRTTVGRAWASRMRQEHLAVGAFAQIALELAEDGCDPVVLELITRASSDEVRHATICGRVAAALLGDSAVPTIQRGVPSIPKHEGAPLSQRVLFHVVEMCCLNETFTGVYLTEMLARTTHPTVRAALESLLADEIDHGRAGWAYLATRMGDPGLQGLVTVLPELVARSMDPVLQAATKHPEPDDAALESLGYLGADAGAALYREAFREVIAPGFEALAIGVAPELLVAYG